MKGSCHPSTYDIIRRRVWLLRSLTILLGLSFTLAAIGQKHFDFNPRCQQAYHEIIQLRLQAGETILQAEEKKDPSNLIPAFLENYIDFLTLFFNEDLNQYQARKAQLDSRLQLIDKGPANSPFYLFAKSVIHFQRAAIKIKFGENWDAAWEFRRSFLQSKENQERFPGFAPAAMLSGAMEVVAGTIPDGYKWLSSLLGIKGSITQGMRQLNAFLSSPDPWALVFRDEARFYYLYLMFYVENKHEEVFRYIRQNDLDLQNNHLYTYLAVNLAVNDQQSAYAQQVMRDMNRSPAYLDMPVWDLEWGYAALNHLDTDANIYLERFLRNFKGQFYVKDVLLKLSWYYELQGDPERASIYRKKVLSRGDVRADADKEAMKEAGGGKWPNPSLLRARLLSDGGYFGEALQTLKGMSTSDFGNPEEKCEFAYRLGRIYDDLGRKDEAIGAYLTTIKTGEHLTAYFAARAALQTGYIYEERGDRETAIGYFQKCLSLKDHEYKNSLDQRAKAGIARCKGE